MRHSCIQLQRVLLALRAGTRMTSSCVPSLSTAPHHDFTVAAVLGLLAGSGLACHEADAPPSSTFVTLPVVGGHAGITTDGRTILKPLQNDQRGIREREFYEKVFAPTRSSLPPAPFLPRLYGITVDASGALCLRLENLTAGLARPCVMDIKMGVQAWGEDASPAKAAAEGSKYPLMAKVGMRVTGMRCARAGGVIEHGRGYGYALREGDMHMPFEEWLSDGVRVRVEAIPPLLHKLRLIQAWMAAQGEFRFYGSSLLFVYDDADAVGTVDVRMIDFAHVWPIRDAGGRDTGYLTGLATIIAQLENVMREHATKPA